MSVVRIEPMKDRQTRNCKGLIEATCCVVEMLDNRVEGYAVVAWDGRGGCAACVKSGGPVSMDLLPTFIAQKLSEG